MGESFWEQGFVKDDQSFQDEKEESENIFCFVFCQSFSKWQGIYLCLSAIILMRVNESSGRVSATSKTVSWAAFTSG